MQELWPLMGYELRSKLAGINDPSKAEQVLGEVLSVVQHYLPPDGGTVHEAMDKIIGLVDPWPLGAASAAAALFVRRRGQRPYGFHCAAFRAPTPLEVAAEEYARAEQNLSMASLRARRASEEVRDALSAESDAMHARATALGKLTEAALPKHPYAGQS